MRDFYEEGILDEGCLNAQKVADKCLKIPYYKYHSEICGVSIDLKTSLFEIVYTYMFLMIMLTFHMKQLNIV